MVKIKVNLFSLKDTFESAQPITFFGDYSNQKLSYASEGNVVEITQNTPNNVLIDGSDPVFAVKDAEIRFRLKEPMDQVYDQINTDAFISSAIEKHKGLRLTLNDPWETTVCFIISQFNNVKRIRLITKKIIDRFGSPIDGTPLKSFPSNEALSELNVKDFFDCGAGFRAKYLKAAADYCTNNLDLYKLRQKDYLSLKEELMQISGVGDKVADCIALMGYGKLEAFPIDVWVKRLIEKEYFNGKTKKIKSIHQFAEDRWGTLAGYAQQYIYHFGRNIDKE